MSLKKTILCIDGNEQSLSICKLMLKTRGYRVIASTSGREAFEIFQKGGIDLVLSDLIIPDFDGRKLVEGIKAISPGTPAILFSGKISRFDADTPADVFLAKGMYDPAELLDRIRLLLVRKRGPGRPLSSPAPGSASRPRTASLPRSVFPGTYGVRCRPM